MRRKTLLLINPANRLRPGFHINRATRNQPLSLGIIAALTPAEWKIKLIDENFREFRYYDADLVGITAFTSTAPRAYELAAIYREKGIPVVMGGIHASMLPNEARRYVDVVVTGEAEPIWKSVIRDFEAGELQRLYSSPFEPVIHQPKPRRDLFHPGYICAGIQTTRGCPLNCHFCSVSAFNGRHYRFRPIDDVLDELEEIEQRIVFFIDDNIIGHNEKTKERARELFEKMLSRGIKKEWISQSSINFADDPSLLKLAYRAGCRMIFLGIESEIEENLQEAGKKMNLQHGTANFEQAFRAINRAGIGVIAGLIYGWDSDNLDSIRHHTRFACQSSANSFQTSVLTPLPGTALFDKIQQEGRLRFSDFPKDWERYDYFESTIVHPHLSPEKLEAAIEASKRTIFSRFQIVKKILGTLVRTKKWRTTLILGLNYWHYRNIILKGKFRKPKEREWSDR